MTHVKRIKLIEVPEAQTTVIGALCGDMIGSPYEYPESKRITRSDFDPFAKKLRFTDDTVMTIAIMVVFLEYGRHLPKDFTKILKDFRQRYYRRGYGKGFKAWCRGEGTNNSFANGAAMRVSSVGYVGKSLEEVIRLAVKTARPTHNHPLALGAATAVAVAIFRSLQDADKAFIGEAVEKEFSRWGKTISYRMRPHSYGQFYEKSVSKAFPSVPQAIACFIHSPDAESAIREAVACGRDADTQASIAGAISCAYYQKIPRYIIEGLPSLPEEFIDVIVRFSKKYKVPKIELIEN